LNAFLAAKVGSGFDIAASIYGSQLYRRFSNVDTLKNDLVPFLQSLTSTNSVTFSKATLTRFRTLFGTFEKAFDYEVRPIGQNLASKIDLRLIDVGSGSDTRLMVRQVLQWSSDLAHQESG